MTSHLHVTMLGRFDMWVGSSSGGNVECCALPLPATSKSQSLLAYLLLNRNTPLSRDALAEMYWPGRPVRRARRSLSTALWHIRRCFAPVDPLQCDHQFVRMVWPHDVVIDIEAFEAAIRQATGKSALQEAVDLYAGDFLPGFYDDWILRKRDWAKTLYLDALLRLMAQYEAQGDHRQALTVARQVLALDACNEAAHRAAMRAYAAMGQRAAALAQYQRCQEVLAREMAVPPSAKTVAQYQRLLNQETVSTLQTSVVTTSIARPPTLTPSSTDPDSPPLVGRDEELTQLRARWQKAVAGRGSILFLRGEAGIGKTRLLATLADETRRKGGAVIGLQCYEYEQGESYGALIEVLCEALAAGGEDLIQEISAWQVANLARLAPQLRARLPAGAQYMTASAAGQKHLLRAMTRLLTTLAHRLPLLLLMDDLQWAHETILAWLPMLAREVETTPLLLIGAYRIEEVAPADLLTRIIFRLERENRAESRTLKRLTTQDLAQWLPGLALADIARIHRHTEGNPFFVLETVRTLIDQGHLQYADGRYHLQNEDFDPPLPNSVRQAITIRLDRLTPAARQGLAVAAVLGRVFDLDVWMQVWNQDEESMMETLDELLRSHLVQENADAINRDYRFEHHLVRETVYQSIPKRHCQQLHMRTAKTLVGLSAEESGVGAEIAFHYLRAGEPQKARSWLLRAGDQAVAVAATGEALRFYKQALASYPQSGANRYEQAMLRRRIGETHFHRGEYEQAETYLLQALALLERSMPAPGLPLHTAVSTALAHQAAHRLIPGAGRSGRTAVTPALREEVAIYTSLGWIYSLQSRYEPYLLVSLRALNASEDAGYARGIAVAATALGLAADLAGWFGFASRFYERAKTVVAQVNQSEDVGFVAFGQSYHAYLTGNEETMLQQAILAAEKYRQVGDAHRWALAMTLQMYVMAHRGQLDEVQRTGEELVKIGTELEDVEARCLGESLSGLVRRWRGEYEEAGAHYRQAADLAQQIPDTMALVENLAGQARCLLRLGQWPEARQTLERARQIVFEEEVRGDAAGKFSVAAFEAALWAAEHLPDARAMWLPRARQAMIEARKQARAFRPAAPELWRLCGRYEWLRERPDSARKWWEKSLARAEELDHRLDWAVTALEMGLRLGDAELRNAGQARLEQACAAGEIKFLDETILKRKQGRMKR